MLPVRKWSTTERRDTDDDRESARMQDTGEASIDLACVEESR